MKTRILIVEDQFIEANNLKMILVAAGYKVCGIASSVAEALRLIEEEKPHMVLLDIHLRGPLTGIDLAEKLKGDTAFVFLSANSNQQTLDAAKVTKPYGFLVKPFRERDVLIMLEVALHRYHFEKKDASGTREPAFPDLDMIGSSTVFADVLEQVKVVAQSETSVLVLGETGTGKELIARTIHQLSERRSRPFIPLNCAALPAELIESELFGHERGSFTGAFEKRMGKFEQANGGTIFLDEIGELPLHLQSKFLRVLQEKEIESIGGHRRAVDVRVIAATNRNLETEMANGRFRMDLYYRLNVFPILLPALRDRKEDIPLLASHFIGLYASQMNRPARELSPAALQAMLDYSWPGNIRELENMMERSVIISDSPVIRHVPLPSDNPKNVPVPAEHNTAGDQLKTFIEVEKDHILAALEKCSGRLSGPNGAAALLNIHPSTLLSRMKKLGIKKKITESF